jgi:hypothetical protein
MTSYYLRIARYFLATAAMSGFGIRWESETRGLRTMAGVNLPRPSSLCLRRIPPTKR